MKRADRRSPRRAAGLSNPMNCRRAWHVPHVITLRAQPSTEVRVLPIEEKTLVEALDGVERFAPREHARAGYPVDLHTLLAASNRLVDDDVAPPDRKEWGDFTKERRTAKQSGEHVRVSARASLHGAIGIEDARPGNRTLRLRVEDTLQSRDRACHQATVGIHDQNVWRGGRGESLVHAARKADIRVVASQPDVGQKLIHLRRAAIDRRVVDNHTLPRLAGHLVGY